MRRRGLPLIPSSWRAWVFEGRQYARRADGSVVYQVRPDVWHTSMLFSSTPTHRIWRTA